MRHSSEAASLEGLSKHRKVISSGLIGALQVQVAHRRVCRFSRVGGIDSIPQAEAILKRLLDHRVRQPCPGQDRVGAVLSGLG